MIEKKSYDFSDEYKDSAFVTTRKKIILDIYKKVIKNKYKEISDFYENEQKSLLQNKIDENGKSKLTEYLQFKSNCENLLGVFGEIIIKKIKNLSFLLKVNFDPKIKKFNIDNIPTEMKKALNKNGIKKHQFNDTEFALNIFKNFIEKYDKNTNYLNFFGRLVKDKKHRKALDWIGIIRKKKLNESHAQQKSFCEINDEKNENNTINSDSENNKSYNNK